MTLRALLDAEAGRLNEAFRRHAPARSTVMTVSLPVDLERLDRELRLRYHPGWPEKGTPTRHASSTFTARENTVTDHRPDYDKIDELERELGIGQEPPQPEPPLPVLHAVIERDSGETLEITSWGAL